MLPPGLLISSSATVLPASDSRRGAGFAALRAVSFLGSTKVKGIGISSHRIRHHLAASRTRRPTPDHRRKLARRAARYHQMNRFRRSKLLVAGLAIDGHLLIQVNVLRTFAAVGLGIRSNGDAGILKQEVAHIALAPAVAMDGLHMLRTEHYQRFKAQAESITPAGGCCRRDSLQHRARRSPGMLADSMRRLAREQRHGALIRGQPAFHMQRLPRTLLLILCDAIRKLPRIPQRRHIDRVRPRASDIQQDQLQRAAQRAVRAGYVAEYVLPA